MRRENRFEQLRDPYFFITTILLLFSVGAIIWGITLLVNPEKSPFKKKEKAKVETQNLEIKANTNRRWILTNSNINNSKLIYTVKTNKEIEKAPSFKVINTSLKGNLDKVDTKTYRSKINIAGLDPGEYEIQGILKTADKILKTKKNKFILSKPLYVIFSIDYEGVDVPNDELVELEAFSARHHNLPIVHFFNPRIYTTNDVRKDRANYLTDWVQGQTTKGDEIGMHLHMHHDMVKAAGVKPKKKPKWTDYLTNGHDVPSSVYSYDQFNKIVTWAKEQFDINGLGIPFSFRAGGWFIDEKGLKVLSDNGFKVDSSGRSHYIWGANNIEGHWNLQPTTQPYLISETDQNKSVPPYLELWEFPNNGGDGYFYKSKELIERFEQNYTDKILQSPKVVTFLSHPHAFSKDTKELDPLYDHIDKYSFKSDKGPVVYTTFKAAFKNMELK